MLLFVVQFQFGIPVELCGIMIVSSFWLRKLAAAYSDGFSIGSLSGIKLL